MLKIDLLRNSSFSPFRKGKSNSEEIMPNIELKERGIHQDECTENTHGEAYRREKDRRTEFEVTAEKNLSAKRAMAGELISMGLSRRSINRILHLKGKMNIK